MPDAFIFSETYKYEMFGITGNGDIWQVWFDHGRTPYLQLLAGDELEYASVIRLLRARKDLYR